MLTIAITSLVLNLTINEFGFFFGVALLVGAALTSINLFLNFDHQINEKIIMESIADAFAGLVILTYPEVSQRFVLTDFSFWIAIMGMLYLNAGFFNHQGAKYFWLYVLSGIALLVFGFVIINYTSEAFGSVLYLMSFSVAIYSLVNFYLNFSRKKPPLQP